MNKKELVNFNTRIPIELRTQLRIISATDDIKIQDLTTELLILGLKEYKK